jgi:hypothetical protein
VLQARNMQCALQGEGYDNCSCKTFILGFFYGTFYHTWEEERYDLGNSQS